MHQLRQMSKIMWLTGSNWAVAPVFPLLLEAPNYLAGNLSLGQLMQTLTVASQKRKLNRRLKVAEKVDGISALVVELRKQRGLSAAGYPDGVDGAGLADAGPGTGLSEALTAGAVTASTCQSPSSSRRGAES